MTTKEYYGHLGVTDMMPDHVRKKELNAGEKDDAPVEKKVKKEKDHLPVKSSPMNLTRQDNPECHPPAGMDSPPIPAIHFDQTEVSAEYLRIGQLRAQLCEYSISQFDKMSKAKAYELTVQLYNNGEIIKELHDHKSDRHIVVRTLQRWISKYKNSEKDYFCLAPSYPTGSGAVIVSEDEEKFLLRYYLNPNQQRIGSIIKMLKRFSGDRSLISPSSESTLRRWLLQYAQDNPLVVNLMRKGEKFIKDNIIKYIERDANFFQVGDVWVGDGNFLNFPIINPLTGKPQRMVFVAWMDWRSRYITGGSIALTEDTLNITNAFRAGVINWKGVPRAILMDHGRAFKSKFFIGKKSDEYPDLSIELGGLFTRLGIEEHFAKPYNARAKPIERWFKTFNDGFERFLDSYIGASITDKPAQHKRNEKFLRKLVNDEPLNLQEAQNLISHYINAHYHKEKHKGLNGATPAQIFNSYKCPPERRISPSQLNYMMLKGEVKTVGRNGIRHLHVNYWHLKLTNLVGQKVFFRWDPNDMRSVLIYKKTGQMICQAEKVFQHHPLVSLDPNKELSEKVLKRELKHQAKVLKNAKKQAMTTLSKTAQIDHKIAEKISTDTKSLFNNKKYLEQKKEKRSLDEQIADQVEFTDKIPKEKKNGISLKELGI